MRKACLDMVYDLAKIDNRIFFVGSDIGFETLKEFKEQMPERFFVEGVNEANIVGMACGLAMEGKIVYVNTIATFLSRRCFEQVVLDLCLHNVNVRLIANGGGLVYAPLGPTHLAIDDIAIMRSIPNMTIIAPADAQEMRRFMPLTVDHKGPMYIRLAKGNDPIVTNSDIPLEIGKAVVTRTGEDALIVTTGVGLGIAQEAATRLSREGIETAILHMPTIKPIDKESILLYARPVSVVLSVEEHTIIGGLGGAVAEIIAEANFSTVKKFKRIGIPDVFAHTYGSQEQLMDYYGISTQNVVVTIKDLFQYNLLNRR